MDEDRLTPQLGRLIDAVKVAARRAASGAPGAEAVALLAEDGTVFAGSAEQGGTGIETSAAGAARRAALASGHEKIEAAAVAVDEPGETILPSAASRAILALIDPDLPLVFKQRGRWVMFPLSQLPSRE